MSPTNSILKGWVMEAFYGFAVVVLLWITLCYLGLRPNR